MAATEGSPLKVGIMAISLSVLDIVVLRQHGTISNTDRLIAKIPIFNGDPSVAAIDTWLDLCKDIFAQNKVLPEIQLPLLKLHHSDGLDSKLHILCACITLKAQNKLPGPSLMEVISTRAQSHNPD